MPALSTIRTRTQARNFVSALCTSIDSVPEREVLRWLYREHVAIARNTSQPVVVRKAAKAIALEARAKLQA